MKSMLIPMRSLVFTNVININELNLRGSRVFKLGFNFFPIGFCEKKQVVGGQFNN